MVFLKHMHNLAHKHQPEIVNGIIDANAKHASFFKAAM